MKNRIFRLFLYMVLVLVFTTSCSDWTDIESIDLNQADIADENSELYTQYLKNLREYKKSDHKLVYVWFDNSIKTPFSRAHHITDLPDSIDIIGLIHPDNLSDWELKEMEKIRKEKATKIIYTIDFESIKSAYNIKLEHATGEEPVSEEFVEFLIDSLGYSLSLADKYNYDGICVAYEGKSRLHMRPNELIEYTENETAFIKIINDWHNRNPHKTISYEGKPQNLIDPSLLDDCISILISGKESTNINHFTYLLQLSVVDNVPQDRFGMIVMATDLNDPNKKIGYFANGTLAMVGLAEWATIAYDGIEVSAVGVYNVSTDYYTSIQEYHYTRNLISTVNPSVK